MAPAELLHVKVGKSRRVAMTALHTLIENHTRTMSSVQGRRGRNTERAWGVFAVIGTGCIGSRREIEPQFSMAGKAS